MAEEDHQEASKASSRPDGAAWTALGAASREKADAFLDEQTILTRLQAKELVHELALRHWSMRFGNLSAVMKVSFEIAVALIMVSIAVFIGGAVWSAAHDDGLVIEAFSVPPDLAARGMTGEVVAGRMLDRLSAMQAQTDTLRAANSYTNNWGNNIKVQIPDTGVSVGEFNRYLHQWLGHETHISGDVVRAGSRLVVTARAGADAGQAFSGPDADLDQLLQQAAEAVYARTQPYRYGVFLMQHDKLEQAIVVFTQITQTGTASEEAWGDVGLANALAAENRLPAAEKAERAAVALEPRFSLGVYRLGSLAAGLGHEQMSLEAEQNVGLLADSAGSGINPKMLPMMRPATAGQADDLLGDYLDEANQTATLRTLPNVLRVVQEGAVYTQANALAEDHDLRAALSLVGGAGALTEASTYGKKGAIFGQVVEENLNAIRMVGAWAQRNWRETLTAARAADAIEEKLDAESLASNYRPTEIWPYLALAEANTGNRAAAHALIDRTPRDCGPCIRARGNIRTAEKNWNAAAFWFASDVKQAPSIPYAYADWGAMLLKKGDIDGAIAEFRTANQKGPHFADPLEMWGEALLRKNRADLARAKFEEANKYAPNWGRLHLKWGEALLWSGDKAAAAQQFALAATLDLLPAEKAELRSVANLPSP